MDVKQLEHEERKVHDSLSSEAKKVVDRRDAEDDWA